MKGRLQLFLNYEEVLNYEEGRIWDDMADLASFCCFVQSSRRCFCGNSWSIPTHSCIVRVCVMTCDSEEEGYR